MKANKSMIIRFQTLTWWPRHVTIRGPRHVTRRWPIWTHWKPRPWTKSKPVIWSWTHSWSRTMHKGVGSSWREWWTHSWVHHPRWWWTPGRKTMKDTYQQLEIQRSLSTASRYQAEKKVSFTACHSGNL